MSTLFELKDGHLSKQYYIRGTCLCATQRGTLLWLIIAKVQQLQQKLQVNLS